MLSPAEMQLLLSRTGLVLNPGQVADLVLAWRQVAALIASIPHDRPLVDDLAYAFRLTPPAAPAVKVAKVAKARPKPAPRAKAKATARRAVPAAKAKRKAKAPAKRPAVKPKGRKVARRRR